MPEVSAVVSAAERLHSERDEESLEILVGMRAKAIEQNPALKDYVDLPLPSKYETESLEAVEDVKALGRRILNRWNKELYAIVCNTKAEEDKTRKAVLESLNLGETAVVAAVAGALLSLGVAAAIAAALAPLIVKRFIWPAKDELCSAWGDAVKS
jgi:formate dehydrogenase maturation protein FdhE